MLVVFLDAAHRHRFLYCIASEGQTHGVRHLEAGHASSIEPVAVISDSDLRDLLLSRSDWNGLETVREYLLE